MRLIAAVTAGVCRAVTENRGAAAGGGGDDVVGVQRRVRERTTSPLAPAARAVTRASVTSRAAPRTEFTAPRRSRVATIIGAASGVETVAISALTP